MKIYQQLVKAVLYWLQMLADAKVFVHNQPDLGVVGVAGLRAPSDLL